MRFIIEQAAVTFASNEAREFFFKTKNEIDIFLTETSQVDYCSEIIRPCP